MPRSAASAIGGDNIAAFLDLLAFTEGTKTVKSSDDGYNVLVGSTAARPLLFKDYSTHPNIYNAKANSTAAGRYQLLARYFKPYQRLLRLSDFGPLAQDAIAVQMLIEQKAFKVIQRGDLRSALALTCDIWASLPGSPYGQHTYSYDACAKEFMACGGKATTP